MPPCLGPLLRVGDRHLLLLLLLPASSGLPRLPLLSLPHLARFHPPTPILPLLPNSLTVVRLPVPRTTSISSSPSPAGVSCRTKLTRLESDRISKSTYFDLFSILTSSLVKDTVEDLTPRNICQPGASFAAIVAGDSRFGVDAGVFPRGTGVGVDAVAALVVEGSWPRW